MKPSTNKTTKTILDLIQQHHNSTHEKHIQILREAYVDTQTKIQYAEKNKSAIILVGENFIESLESIFLSGDYKVSLQSIGIGDSLSNGMCEDSLRSALIYAILHEVAHAKRGHLKYWRGKRYRISPYARNRIEADADAMASGWLAPCVFREKLNVTGFSDWWFSALTAIPILYSHWDTGTTFEDYPEVSVRYFISNFRITKFANEHLPEIAPVFPELLINVNQVARAFCESRNMQTTHFDNSAAIGDWCKFHFCKMGNFMKNIYKDSDFKEIL